MPFILLNQNNKSCISYDVFMILLWAIKKKLEYLQLDF